MPSTPLQTIHLELVGFIWLHSPAYVPSPQSGQDHPSRRLSPPSSQFLPQYVAMGRIDPLVVIFHELPPLEAEFVTVKFHGIGVASLDVKHDLVDIGKLPVFFGFEVIEDGRHEL